MSKQTALRCLACLTLGVAACALVVFLPGAGWAQLTNYKTAVTFHEPVEVSGSDPQVLPAGTYTFKVVDSKVNRNIVQISNEDESHIYTTILAIPIHRDEASDKTVMTFEERAAGEPQALRAWFYPHEKEGQEFVFSKADAARLAKLSNSPVPYSESAADVRPPAVKLTASASSIGAPASPPQPAPIFSALPNGETTQNAPFAQQALLAPSAEPSPARNAVAQAAEPRTANTANTAAPVTTPASELPRTGSLLPFFVLAGCFSVIAGLSLRALSGR